MICSEVWREPHLLRTPAFGIPSLGISSKTQFAEKCGEKRHFHMIDIYGLCVFALRDRRMLSASSMALSAAEVIQSLYPGSTSLLNPVLVCSLGFVTTPPVAGHFYPTFVINREHFQFGFLREC